MSTNIITRRRFLNRAGGTVAAAGLASALPWRNEASAQSVQLVGAIWGGPWVEAAKAITAKNPKFNVKWELHIGGAANIVPKIQAAWPNVPYDFVGQYNPLLGMSRSLLK